MKIVVSGLTGAGKTSVAKGIASRLSYLWVHGSTVRQEVLGLNVQTRDATKYWRTSVLAQRLEAARTNDPSREIIVERRLAEIIEEKNNIVIDAWFVAWLVRHIECIRIWLECGEAERAARIASQLEVSTPEAIEVIRRKDKAAIEFARAAYGIDLLNDRSPFTCVYQTDAMSISEVEVTILRSIARDGSSQLQ